MNKFIYLTCFCVLFCMIAIHTEGQQPTPPPLPDIVNNCMDKMINETDLCINKSEKDWDITDPKYMNDIQFCCGHWEVGDCIAVNAKVCNFLFLF